MKTKYFDDVMPFNQKFACQELVSNLIPDEFYKKFDSCQIMAWADLFARGGFAAYDERLKKQLTGEAGSGSSVGTFVRVGQRLWFEAVDDCGWWATELTAKQLWKWRTLYMDFTSSCMGVANFYSDFEQQKAQELSDRLLGQAQMVAVFRALLSLGGLYCPEKSRGNSFSPLTSNAN